MSGFPFLIDSDGLKLFVRVTPRAKRSAVEGIVPTDGGRHAVAIRLAAPPVEGAANKALIRYLADRLDIPASRIAIVGGERSRLKTVRIAGVGPAVMAALHP